MKKIILAVLTIIVIAMVIVYALPIIQDKQAKSALQKTMNGVPYFNEYKTCLGLKFVAKNPKSEEPTSIECGYKPSQDFSTTMEKYDDYLKNAGWTFIEKKQIDETTQYVYQKEEYSLSISTSMRPTRAVMVGSDYNKPIEHNPYVGLKVQLID